MTTETPVNAEVAVTPAEPVTDQQTLMGYAAAEAATTTVPNDAGVIQTPSDNTQESAPWYLADGVVGQGVKPEYLLEKYSSVDAQAQGYKEIFDKLSAHQGAPVEYNLDFIKETGVEIDPNQPQFKEFMELSKEENISQKYFQQAISKYIELEKVRTPNLEEERAKLGPDGAETMNTIRQWAINNMPADEAQALCYMAVSAAGVRALDRLRNNSQPSSIPTDATKIPKPVALNTVAQLNQEMVDNYDKYKADANYRAEYSKRLAQATMAEQTQL